MMKLKTLSYIENKDSPTKWELKDLLLGDRNLLVGKNASGKSRAINVIKSLGDSLMSKRPPGDSGSYSCIFDFDSNLYEYSFEASNKEIIYEKLIVNDEVVLDRSVGGMGRIKYQKLGAMIDFQTPQNMLAAVARRDAIQHDFLEPLFLWGSEMRYYKFGLDQPKHSLVVFSEGGQKIDEQDQNQIAGLFRDAAKKFGQQFIDQLKSDLAEINYFVNDVALKQPITIKIEGIPNDVLSLCVQEEDLECYTDQFGMSDGMFRALSILIFINYYELSKKGGCFIIDDIGEGLDFDRSCKLIGLLREKAESAGIQLLMSTNDKFVMNEVPLNEWSVLQRTGSIVNVKNQSNSSEIFENFEFTGLSNFSFLEMDFLHNSEEF